MASAAITKELVTRLTVLTIFAAVIISGCSKTADDYRTSGVSPVKIRGFEYRDDMGQTLADIGYPDIRLRYPDNSDYTQWTMGMVTFPNPSYGSMYLYFKALPSNSPVRIWMVPATLANQVPGAISFPGNTLLTQLSRPVYDTVISGSVLKSEMFLRGFAQGYYRIYFKSQGVLLWDNVVIINQAK